MYNNEFYLIPESSEILEISLYKLSKDLRKATYIKPLINGIDSVDTVLKEINGLWYMFTSPNRSKNHISHMNNFEIYYSRNPIDSNFKSINNFETNAFGFANSRMAGNIIRNANTFYRPTQDSSNFYGETISINRILKIGEDGYKEKMIGKLKVPSFAIAMHTYNETDTIIVADFMIIQKKRKSIIILNFYRYYLRIFKIYDLIRRHIIKS